MAKRRHRRKAARKHKNPASKSRSFASRAGRVYSKAKNFASANNLMDMLKNSAAIVLGIKAPDMILSKITSGEKPLLTGVPKALVQIVAGFLTRKYGKSKFADLLGTTISAGGVAELIDQTGVLSTIGKFSLQNTSAVSGLGNNISNPFLKSNPANVNYMPIAQTKGLGEVRYQKLS